MSKNHKGWCGQTWLLPIKRWATLSQLCWSHGYAHLRSPRLHTHGHLPVALASIYGLHSTTDLILWCGRLSAQKPTTLVVPPLSILSYTNPTKYRICTFPDPGPICLTEKHPFSDRPTKTSPGHPSASPSQLPTENPYNHPTRVHLKLPIKNPPISSCRGPLEFSQEKSIR